MIKLTGIFPPLPTAFDANENLVLDKIQDNIKRLSQFDLSGFLILGSNGEMVMLSENEKKRVFDTARKAIPNGKLMLAGTGMQSTAETIRLSKVAAEAGADAVLVLNPSYYKGLMTKEALVNHYRAVADSVTIPVIVYNMPACSGLDLSAEVIAEVSNHPNIIGLKDSSGDIGKMSEVLINVEPDFQVLTGTASVLLPALTLGAVGGILALANIAPQQCLDILANHRDGDIEKARQIQNKMIPVINAVTRDGGIPALKAAMDYLGLYGGPARRPILPLDDEKKKQLLKLLDENGIKL